MADGAGRHGALRRALMWLATLSILGQVIYNLEISRYTLYTGEPIFTGKFRTLPGPHFWLFVYLTARLWFCVSVSGRQCRHAAGGGDPGQDTGLHRNLDHAALLRPGVCANARRH